jgi:hypothetical protein|tara:strand:- start:6 stop:386 length:381 start_codon:yes stop_codon:yes gene_type:complete
MAISETGMLGVKSAEQRKGAMAAEFYPEHMMLFDMWYFLGHAVGHLNLEVHATTAKGRAANEVRAELAEKHKGRYGSEQLVRNLDLMDHLYNILEQETGSLSVPFVKNHPSEIGGMISVASLSGGF